MMTPVLGNARIPSPRPMQLIDTYLADDDIADRSPIYKRESKVVGTFQGGGFVHAVPKLGCDDRTLMGKAVDAVCN
jgi:hypothetical protein